MSHAFHVTIDCPFCEEGIEIEVIINEEDDAPEECPHCGKALDQGKLSEEATEAAMCQGAGD